LYRAGRFFDTPILVGSNADEGAGFGSQEAILAKLKAFAATEGCQAQAAAVARLYPITQESNATTAFADMMRERVFAWNAWTWARLQSEHGQNKAYVYYFDVRTHGFPRGPRHGDE